MIIIQHNTLDQKLYTVCVGTDTKNILPNSIQKQEQIDDRHKQTYAYTKLYAMYV